MSKPDQPTNPELSGNDLIPNYSALAVCILNEKFSIDAAVRCFVGRTNSGIKKMVINKSITDADIENMIALREKKVPYYKIGELYNLTRNAVYGRIRLYKKRKQEAV